MSGEIVDITKALEKRQFESKEKRLKNMREAFRAARLAAKPALKSNSTRSANNKRKRKAKPPSS